jgi:uncharacterized protein (DUF305 family)
MKRLSALVLTAALYAVLAAPALAQHAGHGSAAAKTGDSSATKGFKEANKKMHKDMAITYTGNTDVDFIRGMIPHHQGAIDMAKVELAHGKDPVTRKMAEKIIADQEREIAEMKNWLAKNAK